MDEHSWVITSTRSERIFRPKVKREAIFVNAQLKNLNGGEIREVSFVIDYDEQSNQGVYMQRALEAMRIE